jgi:hypothetical protein
VDVEDSRGLKRDQRREGIKRPKKKRKQREEKSPAACQK